MCNLYIGKAEMFCRNLHEFENIYKILNRVCILPHVKNIYLYELKRFH